MSTQLWMRLKCGGCRKAFTADPERVPMFTWRSGDRKPCCRSCWDMRNKLRVRFGMPESGRPLAYPEDYPPVT